MPEVSVRTAWERLLPPGTQLLGGGEGLDRPLGWPVVLRTHPPAFDPLRGGELAIVPLDRLHLLDDRLTLARVVTQLARTRIGAVAAIGPVDAEAIRAAEAAGVPLFGLPDGTSAADVQAAITRGVAELRVQLSHRSGEIARELNQLAIEGRGRAAIARRAGQLAEAVAVLADADGGGGLAYLPPAFPLPRASVEELVASARWSTGPEVVARRPLGDGLVALSATITGAKGRPAGHLSLLLAGREPSGIELALLEHAAAACAIDLAREDAALAARDELLGDFLDELLSGQIASEEAVERRGRQLGYDLSQPHAVLAVEARSAPGWAGEVAARVAADPAVRQPLAVRATERAVIVLAPLGDAAAERPEQVAARASGPPGGAGGPAAVGLADAASGPRALAEAAGQAIAALEIGRRLGAAGVTRYRDLGLYRLLYELRDRPALARFQRGMIAPLIEHDRRTGGELVRTLDAYLACGCSPTLAAERLHLHRNGLLYRLQRIREVLPHDLDDPEQRLALHLALRIADLIEPRSVERPAPDVAPGTAERVRRAAG